MKPPVSPLPQVGDVITRIDSFEPKRKYHILKVFEDGHGQYIAYLLREGLTNVMPWIIFDTFWSEWELDGPYSDGLENWI